MKQITAIFAAIIFLTSLNLYSSENELAEGKKNGERKFYIGFDNDYTDINGKLSSTLGLSAAYRLNDNFNIGLTANGIWYDYRLNELDPVRTYHVESGYAGIFIEGIYHLTDKIDLNMILMSGQGLVQLKYDGKYRDELKWDEEIIDRETYSVAELKIGTAYNISDFWKLGLTASYRATSDIFIETLDRDMFNNLKFGVAIQYSIF